MPTRFDHLVIAVRDLDSAISRYKKLGFDVQPGGKHTGGVTHNAIIRFGLDYIELLAVYDRQIAGENGIGVTNILDALGEREEILLGYALATATIEQEAECFRNGEPMADLFPLQRTRPDGYLLTWRLLVPGGVSWRRPWPFIIQWDDPDGKRLLLEQPGIHANGATAWNGVTVAVRDLEQAIDLYQNRLHLERLGNDFDACLVGRHTIFGIGKARIDLLKPDSESPAQAILDEIGEGPVEVTFAVKDLEQTRNYLTRQGIAFETDGAGQGTLLLTSPEPAGIRFVLTVSR